MEKIKKTTYYGVIKGIFIFILALLTFFSIVSTTKISTEDVYGGEHANFVQDSALLNLCVLGVVSATAFVGRIFKEKRQAADRIGASSRFFARCEKILLFAALGLSVFVVLSIRSVVWADQYEVQNAAAMIAKGDFSCISDKYLRTYPGQLGLVWLSALWAAVFGAKNYLSLRLLNAVAVVVIYRELSLIQKQLRFSDAVRLGVLVLHLLFLPTVLYTNFVYGTLIGLALSLFAVRKEMSFFQNGKLADAVCAAVGICFAMVIKQNYLIFSIAMILYALFRAPWKQVGSYLLVIFLVFGLWFQGSFPAAFTEWMTGETVKPGATSLSWVAMGLQESPSGPGWWGGYNEGTFMECNYDAQLQAQRSKDDIAASLQKFRNDKPGTLLFFTQKTASQWNEPSFEGMWILHGDHGVEERADWANSLLEKQNADVLAELLNYLQVITYFGALLYCILRCKGQTGYDELLLPMVVIGGFLFHLLWEAKSQYTLPYFILLLPYTVMGYSLLSEKLYRFFIKKEHSVSLRGKLMISAFCLFVVVCVLLCKSRWYECLTQDTAAYAAFLKGV